MTSLAQQMPPFAASAEIDGISIDIVLSALRRLDEALPARGEMDQALHLVSLMFERGFPGVETPYAGGAPWSEQGGAPRRRLRREWEALDHEPTFVDLRWVRLP